MENKATIRLKDLPLKEWEQTVWMFERDIDSCLDKSWMENIAKAEHRELCEILRTIKKAAMSKPIEELTIMEYLQTCNLQDMAEVLFYYALQMAQDVAGMVGGKLTEIMVVNALKQGKGKLIQEYISLLKCPVSELRGQCFDQRKSD